MVARLWGSQTLVNVSTTLSQDWPAIATLSNGNVIVLWRDTGRGNSDVYGRLFSPNGQPLSGEIGFGTGSSIDHHPAVSALPNGEFAVAFDLDVYVTYRKYSAGLVEIGTQTISSRNTPALAGNEADAGFAAIAGQGSSLIFTRYNASHTIIQNETVTSNMVPNTGGDITRLSDGGWAIAWNDSMGSIFLQLVSSNGFIIPGLIDTNSTAPAANASPKVTALQDGAALVTWHGVAGGYPASGDDIYGRIVTDSGSLVGTEQFLINTRTAGNQTFGDAVALKNGNFIVFWSDGGTYIRGQLFNALGVHQGSDFIINTGGSVFASLGIEATLLADGRVAVVWNGSATADGDGTYMQIVDPRDGYVEGSPSSDVLYGHDTFEDLIIGVAGGDTMYGLGGNDSIYGGEGTDNADGGTGNDTIDGGAGGDTLRGGLGDDLLLDDLGDDIIGGDAGNDLIYAGAGNDWIEGGTGDDTMSGGAGGDRLDGQDGNDVMDGGTGDDVLIGGAGNDIFYVDSLGDQVIELPGGGIDIAYSSVTWFGNANVENLVLTGNAAINATMTNDANLVAGNGAANVINGAGGNDTIDGLGGIDWLGGGDGADRLDGGADNDTIQGGTGADALYGGSGADSFYYASYLDSNATQGIDSIQDFQAGLDKINLTPARLSANDSVSIVKAYGNAYVVVDLYGDGINDMIIEVIGATTLSAGDLSFVPPAASAIYYGDGETAHMLTEAQQAAHHRASWDAVF